MQRMANLFIESCPHKGHATLYTKFNKLLWALRVYDAVICNKMRDYSIICNTQRYWLQALRVGGENIHLYPQLPVSVLTAQWEADQDKTYLSSIFKWRLPN